MTIQKTGKNRLDKYYYLAKEQGYRARSAFKLIQLNKKYNFLKNTSTAIDLCAAPGGWLQVLKQELNNKKYGTSTFKSESTIIGIDLENISPIPGVLTLQQDITTEECYQELNSLLKGSKVDTVLNDGAPNVGTNWDHDAYVQNELTLHACKLSYHFLKEGGTFVTKIFRSQNYFDLLFVLKKLFEDVQITKPLSSRNESAEIFAVCLKLKKQIVSGDFFDPEIVFNTNQQKTKKDQILISEILKLDKNVFKAVFVEYNSIKLDIEDNQIFDKNDILDFKDLQQLSNVDKKKLIKKFEKLKAQTISENTKNTKKNEEEIDEHSETQKKINKIKRELKKQERDKKKEEDYKLLRLAKLKGNKIKATKEMRFYDDPLFDNLENQNNNNSENQNNNNSENQNNNNSENQNNNEILEESSDEESFSLESEEADLIVSYKKNPEKFKERTVDKYTHDEHENLPDFFLQEEEEFYQRKVLEEDLNFEDKECILKDRKYKNRQRRRAEAHAGQLIEENQINNEIIVKQKKKEKKQKDVVRMRKGRSVTLRKNIKLVDKRMKADKRKKKNKKY